MSEELRGHLVDDHGAGVARQLQTDEALERLHDALHEITQAEDVDA